MDEVQRFIDRWNGRFLDFDKAYGFQCADLYQQYNKDVVGAFMVANGAAADNWTNYPINFYTKIPNSPTAVPQKGDVVIWKKTASLPYGHIAIATGEGDTKKFKSFDQNWPVGSNCHVQEHTYTGVVGWLRPNKFIARPAEPQTPSVSVPDIESLKKESQAKSDRIQELDGQIQTARENLLLANSKYADLKTEYEAYKAQNPPLAGLSLLELIQLYLKKKSG